MMPLLRFPAVINICELSPTLLNLSIGTKIPKGYLFSLSIPQETVHIGLGFKHVRFDYKNIFRIAYLKISLVGFECFFHFLTIFFIVLKQTFKEFILLNNNKKTEQILLDSVVINGCLIL